MDIAQVMLGVLAICIVCVAIPSNTGLSILWAIAGAFVAHWASGFVLILFQAATFCTSKLLHAPLLGCFFTFWIGHFGSQKKDPRSNLEMQEGKTLFLYIALHEHVYGKVERNEFSKS